MPKPLDLTGLIVGHFTVLERGPSDNRGRAWIVRCACGAKVHRPTRCLTRKGPGDRHCGCGRFENLAGQRFGMLVAVARLLQHPKPGAHWTCQCDCGRAAIVRAKDMKAPSGRTTSCGCRINRLEVTRGEVTARQRIILAELIARPGWLRVSNLLPVVGVDRSSLGRNVKRLDARGYLVRKHGWVRIAGAGRAFLRHEHRIVPRGPPAYVENRV